MKTFLRKKYFYFTWIIIFLYYFSPCKIYARDYKPEIAYEAGENFRISVSKSDLAVEVNDKGQSEKFLNLIFGFDDINYDGESQSVDYVKWIEYGAWVLHGDTNYLSHYEYQITIDGNSVVKDKWIKLDSEDYIGDEENYPVYDKMNSGFSESYIRTINFRIPINKVTWPTSSYNGNIKYCINVRAIYLEREADTSNPNDEQFGGRAQNHKIDPYSTPIILNEKDISTESTANSITIYINKIDDNFWYDAGSDEDKSKRKYCTQRSNGESSYSEVLETDFAGSQEVYSVKYENLESAKDYKFKIFTKNSHNKDNESEAIIIYAKTFRNTSGFDGVKNLRTEEIDSNTVAVKWDQPNNWQEDDEAIPENRRYFIKYSWTGYQDQQNKSYCEYSRSVTVDESKNHVYIYELHGNIDYEFRVYAINGNEDISNPISESIKTNFYSPNSPLGLNVSFNNWSNTDILLRWSPPSDWGDSDYKENDISNRNYKISYSKENSNKSIILDLSDGSLDSHIIYGLDPRKTYVFKIQAINNGDKESSWSEKSEITTLYNTPTLFELKASKINSREVRLNWKINNWGDNSESTEDINQRKYIVSYKKSDSIDIVHFDEQFIIEYSQQEFDHLVDNCIIKNLTPNTNYEFVVIAQNGGYDSIIKKIENVLTLFEKPKTPLFSKIEKSKTAGQNLSEVKLYWEKLDDFDWGDSGSDYDKSERKYILDYKKNIESIWSDPIEINQIPEENNFCILENLDYATLYDFRIYAVNSSEDNKTNKSDYKEVSSVTNYNSPSVIKDLKIYSKSENSLTLSWEELGYDEWGDTVSDLDVNKRKYNLFYKKDNDSSEWSEAKSVDSTNQYSVKNYVFNNLENATQYIFKVEAINAEQNPSSSIIKEKTDYAQPSETSLQVMSRDHQSVELSWENSDNKGWGDSGSEEDKNGRKYTLKYGLNNTNLTNETIVSGYENNIILNNLEFENEYYFSIEKKNIDGKISLATIIKTKIDYSNPDKLQNFKAIVIDKSNRVKISWDRAKKWGDSNSELDKQNRIYIINIEKYGEINSETSYRYCDHSYKKERIEEILELQTFSKYSIKITSENAGGKQSKVSNIVIVNTEDDNSRLLKKFDVKQKSWDYVELEWEVDLDYAKQEDIESIILEYKLSHYGDDIWKEIKNTNILDIYYRIENLQSNTNYDFRIKAINYDNEIRDNKRLLNIKTLSKDSNSNTNNNNNNNNSGNNSNSNQSGGGSSNNNSKPSSSPKPSDLSTEILPEENIKPEIPTPLPIQTYTLNDIKTPEYFKTRDFINGYENKTFKPDQNLTRAEAAQMFYKISYDGTKINFETLNKFGDVNEKDWFSSSVAYLA
ncbi:MAG: fibronectin type III domain-containing protein, partial [Clostridiales bacterium]|nr:fibronectin type III domain-containing protein [Clostridiales bacterium]